MSQVVSLVDYTPAPRFDEIPWTFARIEESDAADGTWAQIDELPLDPVDPDPAEPASRDFTTSLASDTPALWYRIIFADDNNNTGQPSGPVQNLGVSTAPYATRDELARILKIRTPTSEQDVALDRVLVAAACEIRAEIDMEADDLTDAELAICAQVNLDRAADLWRHTESIPGVLGGLDDVVTATPGRYSWERYAQRLAPVKRRWGLA